MRTSNNLEDILLMWISTVKNTLSINRLPHSTYAIDRVSARLGRGKQTRKDGERTSSSKEAQRSVDKSTNIVCSSPGFCRFALSQ